VITDRGAVPVTDPMLAEIVAEPVNTPVARPDVGLTVTSDGVPEVHAAAVVTILVLVSE
jgi:hypothetical protein